MAETRARKSDRTRHRTSNIQDVYTFFPLCAIHTSMLSNPTPSSHAYSAAKECALPSLDMFRGVSRKKSRDDIPTVYDKPRVNNSDRTAAAGAGCTNSTTYTPPNPLRTPASPFFAIPLGKTRLEMALMLVHKKKSLQTE